MDAIVRFAVQELALYRGDFVELDTTHEWRCRYCKQSSADYEIKDRIWFPKTLIHLETCEVLEAQKWLTENET